jgi:hypothetical protein
MAAAGPGQGIVPANGSIIECVNTNGMQQQAGLMVRHYRVSAQTGTGGTLGQIATKLEQVLAPVTIPLLATLANHYGVLVRIVGIGPSSPPAWDTSLAAVGSAAGEVLPKQTAGLISWITAFSGRGNKGRTYVPFPVEASNTQAGVPDVNYQALLTNLASVYFSFQTTAGANNATLEPVLYHRALHTGSPLLGFAVRAKWATQRRRGDFGRINQLGINPAIATIVESERTTWREGM